MSGSLGVGVQLRPPPLFIHRRLPIPPPGPSLAGSVFLNRESSDSPLRVYKEQLKLLRAQRTDESPVTNKQRRHGKLRQFKERAG
ncbi:betaine-homocysteine S-methyltransferase [Sarotherodon galilaeus]